MSQTLRKISEKKLIKEVETNFKLVGILLAIAAPGRAVQGRRGPDPCPRDGESFILMGKVGIFHQNLTRFCGNLSSSILTILCIDIHNTLAISLLKWEHRCLSSKPLAMGGLSGNL